LIGFKSGSTHRGTWGYLLVIEHLGFYRARAVVQDAIHGIIPINEAEYYLIQTPFFRRLHDIKQLGLSNLVFPSATHSRFEHSLGVMHLASRVAQKVVEVSRRSSKVCSNLFHECSDRVYRAFVQVARFAGLLHDLGHLPFSHMLEDAVSDLVFNPAERGVSGEGLLRGLGEARARISEVGFGSKIHEAYTIYFTGKLIEIVEESGYENLGVLLGLALGSLNPSLVRVSEELLEDLGVRVEACRLVNNIISSGIVDVDRLDYLVRDAKYTGVIYGYIDIDRVLESLEVKVEGDSVVVKVPPKGFQPVEDVFDARFKMYKTVYYHHKFVGVQIALGNAFTQLLMEWDDLQPKPHSEVLENAGDLLNPVKLSNLIAGGLIYFDDVELLSMFKLMAFKGSRRGRRWAKSILHERHLLPVSLIKRVDEVIAEISRAAGGHVNLIVQELENVANDREVFEGVVERSIARKARELGLDPSEVKVEKTPRKVVRGIGGAPAGIAEASLYIRMLAEVASTPIILVHAYSDDEVVHASLYKERGRLRRAFVDELVGEVVARLRA